MNNKRYQQPPTTNNQNDKRGFWLLPSAFWRASSARADVRPPPRQLQLQLVDSWLGAFVEVWAARACMSRDSYRENIWREQAKKGHCNKLLERTGGSYYHLSLQPAGSHYSPVCEIPTVNLGPPSISSEQAL